MISSPTKRSSIFVPVVRAASLVVLLALLPLTTKAAAQLNSPAKFHIVYSFANSPDGANPFQSPIVRDGRGNLYGTTIHGGTHTYGTVFRMDNAGKENVLLRFKPDLNGRAPSPMSGVVLDASGNLYGTEPFGGPDGHGTVFQLDPSGKLTILYAFTGQSDGAWPVAGLIRDAHGTLYGTASGAGDPQGCGAGCGTVFKLDANGKFEVLYRFTGGGDGGIPLGALVRDSRGNLYGTTLAGGTNDEGVVFKLSKTGQETPLYSFSATGALDGMQPVAGLALDSSGNLYGSTYYGGNGNCFDGFNPGCGTVFELSKAGAFTVLHSLGGDDGGWPTGRLVLDADGTLYGTASGAGAFGSGTIFKITRSGSFSLLHTFTGGRDGADPLAGLVPDGTGTLYGTAGGGGAHGYGVVFTLVP